MWQRKIANAFSKVLWTGLTLTTQVMGGNAEESSTASVEPTPSAGFSNKEVVAISALALMSIAGCVMAVRSQFRNNAPAVVDNRDYHAIAMTHRAG